MDEKELKEIKSELENTYYEFLGDIRMARDYNMGWICAASVFRDDIDDEESDELDDYNCKLAEKILKKRERAFMEYDRLLALERSITKVKKRITKVGAKIIEKQNRKKKTERRDEEMTNERKEFNLITIYGDEIKIIADLEDIEDVYNEMLDDLDANNIYSVGGHGESAIFKGYELTIIDFKKIIGRD